MINDLDALRARAKALQLHGVLAHWQEAIAAGWVQHLLDWEEQERARRSLERRLAEAHIGRFKHLSDFDWKWPERCDRAAIEALMSLDFLKEIGDSHARQQSIQPTGEHTCLWIIFGLRLRQRQPIAIEDRAGALTGRQLLRHLQKSPVE